MPAGRMSLIRQVADVSDKIIKVQCVIPKSGHRFSDKITPNKKQSGMMTRRKIIPL
jgi:hypothetical protein